jgi:hypothetical protein
VTVHGDKFLGNRATQEGGGLMLWGGNTSTLQNIQVITPRAANAACTSCVLCRTQQLELFPVVRNTHTSAHLVNSLV